MLVQNSFRVGFGFIQSLFRVGLVGFWVAESAGTKVYGDTGGIAGDKVGTPHLQQVGLLRRTCFCLVCRDATLAMTNSC